MSDLISMDKKYQTRDGRAVEVLKVDMNSEVYKVAVVLTMEDGSQGIFSRTQTGRAVPDRKSGAIKI